MLSTVLVVVTFAAMVQTALGMGFGLTAAPVLALIDPVLVPVPALYIGTATALAATLNERSAVVWSEVKTGTIGRLTGTVCGAILLLQMTSRETFSLLFGMVILLAVVLSIAGWRLEITVRNLLSMGFISGFTGVITSVGAPPLALIYQHRPANPTRATLSAFFAIGGMASLLILNAVGWGRLTHLWLALMMAPAALLGSWIGRRVRGKFDRRYRVFLLMIATVASLLLIQRGLG